MAKDSNGNPMGKSRGLPRRNNHIADWEQASAEELRNAIAAAASTGGALRFGYSRDGGAYAIGVYGDGETYTEFVKPSDDIDITLNDIKELFEAIADDQASARSSKKRPKTPDTDAVA